MRLILLILTLAACNSDDLCRRALTHAAQVYEASDAPASLKQQMRDGFEDGIAKCRAENPPAAVLECTLAAKSMLDLRKCDALRERR
jgi:hypothetical protein